MHSYEEVREWQMDSKIKTMKLGILQEVDKNYHLGVHFPRHQQEQAPICSWSSQLDHSC